MTKAREILDAALALPSEERAELLAALSESLAPTPMHEDWDAELLERLRQVEAGTAKLVPGHVVDARIRALD